VVVLLAVLVARAGQLAVGLSFPHLDPPELVLQALLKQVGFNQFGWLDRVLLPRAWHLLLFHRFRGILLLKLDSLGWFAEHT